MLKTVVSIGGGGGGGISGSGTANYVPKFATSTSVGDSNLLQGGTTILTKRSAAPSVFNTNNGTLSASSLCTGLVLIGTNLDVNPNGSFNLPTGSSIDTELGLSGSTPTNVTFDCTFTWDYPNDSGYTVSINGNTGAEFAPGTTWDDTPPGGISITDNFKSNVTLRFYRVGSASYYVYVISIAG